ncbi:MAG: pyridoxal phosphate-dependent aminotransferase, partial [Cyclobacteriaceae bacterium]
LRVKSNMDSGMFLPVQRAAARMLQSDPEWYDHLRKTYARRRKTAFRIFDVLECTYVDDQQGMFAWGRVPQNIKAEEWSDEILEQAEVFITPGFIFGPAGNNYLRISLCSPEDILNEALERIIKIK